MTDAIEFTGGARLDLFKAAWPLAKLTVSRDKLILDVVWAGSYTFFQENVSAIERYLVVPIVGSGIRIRHLLPDFPKTIVFLYLGFPSTVLRGIHDAGFLTEADRAVPA